ncbi:zinc finger BED domain-containing protein DAYSLEEPER-like [Miscanthus floridulus]|uniref:zinc finger BED domain-containing protein DAYSLEEPER-like n=1 Tax=Miscanthus floridulus TaxID=154761 RepID=UPI00345AD0F8
MATPNGLTFTVGQITWTTGADDSVAKATEEAWIQPAPTTTSPASDIPLLYSYAFILDPRAKMRGFFNVLQLLGEYTGSKYSSYYADVKTELYKLFNKYESKFGAARSQRVAQPSHHIAYLDSDNVTSYEDDFDLLLWWRDHKLTFPILSIMARDIISVPVSTISSESCFSLIGRIIEEWRRRLSPETMEMLICIKD